MVVGNGMVAKKFAAYQNNDQFLVFASGVSNSKNNDTAAYQREFELLRNTIKEYPGKSLVYFSTCSIEDPDEADSLYVSHKKAIEAYIIKNVAQFHIFRVSNLVGHSGNPNTILNFFYNHIIHKTNFDLWTNSTRNLIDVDDMYRIADHILQEGLFANETISIANPVSHSVKLIVAAIEQFTGITANYIAIAKGNTFAIDVMPIIDIMELLGIEFGGDYIDQLLNKYYQPA